MVSVIVPVYKAEAHLRDCLESILGQDERDLEIILVEDGSPDQSGHICECYREKDGRIQVIHKTNGGVSSARNAGIARATGEYIVFVDSDDYIEPAYVRELLAAAKAHPDVGQVWCSYQTVLDYCSRERGESVSGTPKRFQLQKDIMTLHAMNLDASPWNKLYRTDWIQQHQLRFDESLSLGEDLLFNFAYFDVMESKDILVLPAQLYNYVEAGGESLNSRYRKNLLDIYRHLNKTCETFLRKWQVPEDQMKLFDNSVFFMYEKVLRNTFRSPQMSRKEMYRRNNRLMKSEEFQGVLAKTTCYIHPLYKKAYQIGDYRGITFLDWVHKNVYPRAKHHKK